MRTRHTSTTALAASLALAGLVLAGCAATGTAEGPEQTTDTPTATAPADAATQDLLTRHGLDGLSGQEVVELLDTSTEPRPLAFGASVREDELLVSDGDEEIALPLPEDLFYVSLAPFVEATHDCYYHSLATCQGELATEDVDVLITDEDGTVLVDETATTYANGFVGYWLPRGTTGTIEVTRGELTGSVPFSTGDGDPTCVTTLQLA